MTSKTASAGRRRRKTNPRTSKSHRTNKRTTGGPARQSFKERALAASYGMGSSARQSFKARALATAYGMGAITPVEYAGLQKAYDHFNQELFGGALPDVFITYQRKAHSAGYFSAGRFSGRTSEFAKHELALNPDGFIGKTDSQICQTLVHEQHHVWQHHQGKPSPRGYHNAEWAEKMVLSGLQPSSTGMPGGNQTGQRMSDYPIPGGAFEQAFEKLAAGGWCLNLQSAHFAGPKGGHESKTKFSCSSCGQNAWGKPNLKITCTPCGADMWPARALSPAG